MVSKVLTTPTPNATGFLCPLTANTFGFEFLNFTISDYDTKKVIFEVGRNNPTPLDVAVDFSSVGEDMYRKIKYTFSEDVLRLPKIQTSLIFSVGPREATKVRKVFPLVRGSFSSTLTWVQPNIVSSFE